MLDYFCSLKFNKERGGTMRVFKINACESGGEMILIAKLERGKELTNADYENDAEELRKFIMMLPYKIVKLCLEKFQKKE